MNYSNAYYGPNDGSYNSQPDPSAAAYVPGAQQQHQLVDPATGIPYPGWQQQQPYFGPGALDFNAVPPPLAPAGVYGYQPHYNNPAYTGPLDVLAPQPPAHQGYYAALPPTLSMYNNPAYPDAANFFAQQQQQPAPPVPAYDDGPVYPVGAQQQHVVAPQLPYQIDVADLTPAFIACVAQGDPALALALHAYALRHAVPVPEVESQEVEREPEPESEPGPESESEPEPEPEPESEPEPEADEGDASDEEAQPQPLPQSHAPASILAQFYHGMDKAAADNLSALLVWKRDKEGRVECPVPGCKATYTRPTDALRHVVDNSRACPHCGRPLARWSAYFIRRHEDTEVCREARRAAAAAAAGQH